MTNFFIIRNKEKNMYYWGDGSWTKIKDCARKHQHKDCAETLIQKDNLDYKNCEIVEIPSITDLEAKLADRKQFCESQVKSLTDIIAGLIETKHDLEAKLAEITKKYELASLPMGGLVDTARNLEKQLAEKEKEIEYQESMKILAIKNQNQTAIAELEKVKELIKKHYKKQFPDFPLGVTEKTHINIIDQQISNLKGDK